MVKKQWLEVMGKESSSNQLKHPITSSLNEARKHTGETKAS